MWEGPLFVVGMPRSGTKLLRDLLNGHPRLRIPEAETEFLPFLAKWIGEHGAPAGELEFQSLYEALRGASYFHYRAAEAGEFSWRAWREACGGRFDTAGVFEGFVRCETRATRGSGLIWGDKSPTYIRHLELIFREFPQARVVHIVRDVRDYSASIRKAWGKDLKRAAYRWGVDVLAAHRQCLGEPARSLEMTYENLLGSTDTELRRICSLLQIEFDSRMTQLRKPSENLGDARGQARIVTGNARKYRRGLSAAEIEAVEALAWDAMHALGYQAELARGSRRMTRASLFARKLYDGVRLALGDAEHRGRLRSALFYLSHHRTSRG